MQRVLLYLCLLKIKKQLAGIDELRFIFTSSIFITEKAKKEKVMQTAWMLTEEQKVDLKWLNRDTVWENIVIYVGGVNIEKGNTLDEQIEINEKTEARKRDCKTRKAGKSGETA